MSGDYAKEKKWQLDPWTSNNDLFVNYTISLPISRSCTGLAS